MSDLISRNDLTNKIRGIVPGSQDVDFIVRLIDEQPTAYNPEKVVEELEEYKNWYTSHGFNEDLNRGIIGATNHAIDIVKRGGVE